MNNTGSLIVAVIGATGVLGRAVVPRLLAEGYRVRAQARDPARAIQAAALGADVVAGDILDRASLDAAVDGADVVLHLATAVPGPPAPMDWGPNDRIRREGTVNLLNACRAADVGRYIQQSIAMIHMPGGVALIDEAAPTHPNPVTASAIDMEEYVRATDLDWRILRGGAFYGPGTGREECWLEAARTGSLTIPADGLDYISLIHVTDMARAIVAAVRSETPRASYLVVDDRPLTYAELFGALSAMVGGPPPPTGGPVGLASFRCSNARAQAELDWSPAYPDFWTGIAACR